MRYAHGIMGRAARDKMKKAQTPSERIWAVVEVNFLPEVITPEFFRLWYEAMDDVRLTYLFDIFRHREYSNLLFALKQLTSPQEAGDLAHAIINIYDGYTALMSVDSHFTPQSVLLLIAEYIKSIIPAFDMAVVKLGE